MHVTRTLKNLYKGLTSSHKHAKPSPPAVSPPPSSSTPEIASRRSGTQAATQSMAPRHAAPTQLRAPGPQPAEGPGRAEPNTSPEPELQDTRTKLRLEAVARALAANPPVRGESGHSSLSVDSGRSDRSAIDETPPTPPPPRAPGTPHDSGASPARSEPAPAVPLAAKKRTPLQKLVQGSGDLAQGMAQGLNRKFVKPVAHRVADRVVPHVGTKPDGLRHAPEKGSQFDLKYQGAYGIGGRWPQLHPVHDIFVAGSNLKQAVNEGVSQLPPTNALKRMANKLGIGRADKKDLDSAKHAFRTPMSDTMTRLPKFMVKKGRVQVTPRHLGNLSSSQRKLQRARAQVLQQRLMISGDRVNHVEAHPASDGTLIGYKSGMQRWVGHSGEHMPAPILGVISGPGLPASPRTPPPLGLMTGIAAQLPVNGQDPGLWRVDQGALYKWRDAVDPREGQAWHRQRGVADASGLALQANGRVCIHAPGQLSAIDDQGQLEPVFTDLPDYRSVRMLPALASVAPKAVATDHQGQLFLLTQGADPVHLGQVPGAQDAVPGPDSKSLFVLTQEGDIQAMELSADGLVKSESQPLAALSRQLPLEAGQSWRANTIGFEPSADGRSVNLHALVSTAEGEHRVSMVHDTATGEWQAQYKADGGLLVSDKGMGSPPLKRGTEMRFDERTSMAIDANAELAVRLPGRNRWERLAQADGRPVDGIQRLVTNVHGLTVGKTLYAIRESEGKTAIHRLQTEGRIKVLQHQNNPEVWHAPVPAVLAPDRLTVSLGEPLVQAASSAPKDRITDLAADNAGNIVHLTQAGVVTMTTAAKVASQIGWPAAFEPLMGPPVSRTLPEPTIDGKDYRVTQVILSGDQGKVRALAEPRGVRDGEPKLLEFVPGATDANAAQGEPLPSGKWVDLQLEWINARGDEIANEDKRNARLSTSLWSTDIMEIGSHVGPDDPTKRFRILGIKREQGTDVGDASSTASSTLRDLQHPPPSGVASTRERFRLNSVARSPEAPRIAMDANDALRFPVGFTKKTNIKFSLAGQKGTSKPWTGVLPFSHHENRAEADAPALAEAKRLRSSMSSIEMAGAAIEHGIDEAADYGAELVRRPGVDLAKSLARTVYNQVVSTLTVAPRLALEWKKDLVGRPELKAEYLSVRQAYERLDGLALPATREVARGIERGRPATAATLSAEARAKADAVAHGALEVCLDALQTMCVTARILEPDLVTERKRGPRRTIQKSLAINRSWGQANRDALPTIDAWWAKARETKAAYSDTEIAQIDKIEHCLNLLKKNKVRLWDGLRGHSFASYHASHAVQGAALATAMGHFAEAVELRTLGHTENSKFLPTAGVDASAGRPGRPGEMPPMNTTQNRLDALATTQSSDMVLRLAKREISGWESLESASEVKQAMNRELRKRGTRLTPGSKLYQMIKKDFQIPEAKHLPKDEFIALVGAKWNEMVNSLGPRSTYFWLTRKDLGLGMVANTGFEAIGGGATAAGATVFRRKGMGVETLGTGDGTGQGPQIWFWPRAQGASFSILQSLGVVPKKLQGNGIWGAGVRAEIGAMSSTFKGMASIIDPRDSVRHIKTILDPRASMLDVTEMSINGNSIALAGQENAAGLTFGASVNLNEPDTSHTHDWGNVAATAAGRSRNTFSSIGNVAASFNLTMLSRRWMSLRLRVPGGHGDERQGDGGMRGGLSLNMALGSSGAELKTATENFSAIKLANVGLDISAIDLQAGNFSTYKRTMDFVKAGSIDNDTWLTTLNNARQIEGLQLPLPAGMSPTDMERLDVTQPAGREAMHGLLEHWVDKLQRMEAAVARSTVAGAPLDAQEKNLLAQAQQVDEVKATSFMLLAERMLLQSKLAQQGIPMLQASARIELNIPYVDPTSKDVTSHVRLGAVLKQARRVEQALPELQKVKQAYAKLPGYNETRLVFEIDQRVVNLTNRLIAQGVPRQEWDQMGLPLPDGMAADATHVRFSAGDAAQMLLSNPSVYRMVVYAAKNNEANVISNSMPVGIVMRDEAIISEERFLAETQIKMGWNGRAVRAEMLPAAQHALADRAQGLRPFEKAGIHATTPMASVPGHRAVVVRPASDVFVEQAPAARSRTAAQAGSSTARNLLPIAEESVAPEPNLSALTPGELAAIREGLSLAEQSGNTSAVYRMIAREEAFIERYLGEKSTDPAQVHAALFDRVQRDIHTFTDSTRGRDDLYQSVGTVLDAIRAATGRNIAKAVAVTNELGERLLSSGIALAPRGSDTRMYGFDVHDTVHRMTVGGRQDALQRMEAQAAQALAVLHALGVDSTGKESIPAILDSLEQEGVKRFNDFLLRLQADASLTASPEQKQAVQDLSESYRELRESARMLGRLEGAAVASPQQHLADPTRVEVVPGAEIWQTAARDELFQRGRASGNKNICWFDTMAQLSSGMDRRDSVLTGALLDEHAAHVREAADRLGLTRPGQMVDFDSGAMHLLATHFGLKVHAFQELGDGLLQLSSANIAGPATGRPVYIHNDQRHFEPLWPKFEVEAARVNP